MSAEHSRVGPQKTRAIAQRSPRSAITPASITAANGSARRLWSASAEQNARYPRARSGNRPSWTAQGLGPPATALHEQIHFNRLAYAEHWWDQWYYSATWTASGDPINKLASESVPETFQCPSSPKDQLIKYSHKDYSVPAMEMAEISARDGRGDGIFYTNSGSELMTITDGTSNTFLLLEQSTSSRDFPKRGSNPFFFVSHPCEGMALGRSRPGGSYYVPNPVSTDWAYVMRSARSFHPGGLNAAKADGSVTFVTDTVDTTLWLNTFTPRGNEVDNL